MQLLDDRLHTLNEQAKAIWIWLVALPLVLLTERAFGPEGITAVPVLNGLMTLSFIVRFAIGNWHYAIETYSRNARWIARSHCGQKRRLTARQMSYRFLLDIVLFATHSVALCAMAATIRLPPIFCIATTILLITDIIWFFYEPAVRPNWMTVCLQVWRAERKNTDGAARNVTICLAARYAPRTWVCNNTIASLVLGAVLVLFSNGIFGEHALVALTLTVGFTNGFVDIKSTALGIFGTS